MTTFSNNAHSGGLQELPLAARHGREENVAAAALQRGSIPGGGDGGDGPPLKVSAWVSTTAPLPEMERLMSPVLLPVKLSLVLPCPLLGVHVDDGAPTDCRGGGDAPGGGVQGLRARARTQVDEVSWKST